MNDGSNGRGMNELLERDAIRWRRPVEARRRRRQGRRVMRDFRYAFVGPRDRLSPGGSEATVAGRAVAASRFPNLLRTMRTTANGAARDLTDVARRAEPHQSGTRGAGREAVAAREQDGRRKTRRRYAISASVRAAGDQDGAKGSVVRPSLSPFVDRTRRRARGPSAPRSCVGVLDGDERRISAASGDRRHGSPIEPAFIGTRLDESLGKRLLDAMKTRAGCGGSNAMRGGLELRR
jgi:hypothetical protein